jgi:hypothetical protein
MIIVLRSLLVEFSPHLLLLLNELLVFVLALDLLNICLKLGFQ